MTDLPLPLFSVRHADDAWELGVFFDAGFISESDPELLGVPEHLVEFFKAGQHDCKALAIDRVQQLGDRWDCGLSTRREYQDFADLAYSSDPI